VRVAMVIQSFLPVLGGAQRQLDLLAPLMRDREVDAIAVTRRPAGTPRTESRPGLRVLRMPGADHGPTASIRYTLTATATLMRLRPDVIHVYDILSPGTIGLFGGTLLRTPVMAKILSTGPGGDLDRLSTKPFGDKRLQAIGEHFSAFVCLSDQVRGDLRASGIAERKLRLIPNGVDLDHFRPPDPRERRAARAALGLPDDRLIALFCGRFDPVKRVDVLIDAVAAAAGAHLVLVGEGPCLPALHQIVRARNLSERITFLDRVDDPASIYRAADVYLSSSTTEGMSNSMLEAMASGLPVIATRASGTNELLRTDTGAVVDGGTDPAGALASELDRVGADRDWARERGEGARLLVEGSFSLESVADGLVALYRDLAPSPRARRGASS
jgi:glycosyltransferase involved in cell wall biosynthesis